MNWAYFLFGMSIILMWIVFFIHRYFDDEKWRIQIRINNNNTDALEHIKNILTGEVKKE